MSLSPPTPEENKAEIVARLNNLARLIGSDYYGTVSRVLVVVECDGRDSPAWAISFGYLTDTMRDLALWELAKDWFRSVAWTTMQKSAWTAQDKRAKEKRQKEGKP